MAAAALLPMIEHGGERASEIAIKPSSSCENRPDRFHRDFDFPRWFFSGQMASRLIHVLTRRN